MQDNITAFGGDPGNVTVLGQSAGAGSIPALLVMPAAAGLFHRAILQSLPGTFFTPDLAADVAAEVSAELGRSPRVENLADVAPDDLVAAARSVTDRLPQQAGRWAEHLSFAATSNPGWAPYTPHERDTRVYDAECTIARYPEERSRKIWRERSSSVANSCPSHDVAWLEATAPNLLERLPRTRRYSNSRNRPKRPAMDSDKMLSTTRSVRLKIDLDRPVEHEVIDNCLRLALQAPTPANMPN